MEQISSTFPFQDGLLHFSPISARQQKPPVSDHNSNPLLVFDLLKGDDDDVVPTMKSNVVQQQLLQQQKNLINPRDHHQERKIIRRDVERQRRKEMGSLYKSLVGLIPYEYIKVSTLLSYAIAIQYSSSSIFIHFIVLSIYS